jgi:hypothetical protein
LVFFFFFATWHLAAAVTGVVTPALTVKVVVDRHPPLGQVDGVRR